MFERESEQRVVAFEFEFVTDSGAVVFDGPYAEEELIGDLFVRLVFGDQFQHTPFDGSERGDLWFAVCQLGCAAAAVEQQAGELRADIFLAGGHRANTLDDVGQGTIFDDVASHVQVKRLVKEVLILVHGQEDHRDFEASIADGPGNFKAVPARHIHIENGNIGVRHRQLLPGRFAIFGFVDDDELRRAFNDLSQSVTKDRMVISNEDFDFTGHAFFIDRNVKVVCFCRVATVELSRGFQPLVFTQMFQLHHRG